MASVNGEPREPAFPPFPEYAEYAELDRRQERIQRHMMLSFAAGWVFGGLGVLAGHTRVAGLDLVFNPYAYVLLSMYAGATAGGYGWALLSSLLAGIAPVVSSMAASAVLDGYAAGTWTGGGPQADFMLAGIVVSGVVAHAARRTGPVRTPGPPRGFSSTSSRGLPRGFWAGLGRDLAAGVLGGALLADVAARAAPGMGAYIPGFWPWPALSAGLLAAGAVLCLRRTPGGRARALAAATGLAGLFILLTSLA